MVLHTFFLSFFKWGSQIGPDVSLSVCCTGRCNPRACPVRGPFAGSLAALSELTISLHDCWVVMLAPDPSFLYQPEVYIILHVQCALCTGFGLSSSQTKGHETRVGLTVCLACRMPGVRYSVSVCWPHAPQTLAWQPPHPLSTRTTSTRFVDLVQRLGALVSICSDNLYGGVGE